MRVVRASRILRLWFSEVTELAGRFSQFSSSPSGGFTESERCGVLDKPPPWCWTVVGGLGKLQRKAFPRRPQARGAGMARGARAWTGAHGVATSRATLAEHRYHASCTAPVGH